MVVHELVSHLADYNPRNAVKVKKRGAFTHYFFNDGAVLKVRSKFAGKLLSFPWRKVKALSGQSYVTLFDANGTKVVARPINFDQPGVEKLSELIQRRSRVESPLLELDTPKFGNRLLVTRYFPAENFADLTEDLSQSEREKLIESAAAKLARLHAAGFVHRHPHALNWLLLHGKPELIDPKHVGDVTPPPPRHLETLVARGILSDFHLPALPSDQAKLAKKYALPVTALRIFNDIRLAALGTSIVVRHLTGDQALGVFTRAYLAAYKRELSRLKPRQRASLAARRVWDKLTRK